MSRTRANVRDMKIIDEDRLAETLAFNRTFQAVEQPLEVLRRNRLGGDTPPVRLPQGQDRNANGVPVRVFTPGPRPSSAERPRSRRCSQTSPECHPPGSSSAPRTRWWTTRCAWPTPVQLSVVAGVMHGFTLYPLTITEREQQREREFLAGSGW